MESNLKPCPFCGGGQRYMSKAETEKRLIDANGLKKEIVDFKVNLHPQNQDYGTGYFSALSVVEGMLAYAPTVDAVEVVHGRWRIIDFKGNVECSECGYTMDLEYKYCPACGAKMDGGNGDD